MRIAAAYIRSDFGIAIYTYIEPQLYSISLLNQKLIRQKIVVYETNIRESYFSV